MPPSPDDRPPPARDGWSIPGGLPAGTRVVETTPPASDPRRAVFGRAGAAELVARLRAGRDVLLGRSTAELVALLGAVGERFRAPGDALREEALAALPASAHLSNAMAREVLDGMARDWTRERLGALVEAELGGDPALDGFAPRPGRPGRARALGPAFTVHVCSGSVPGVSVTSLLRGLLVRSAVLLKPGRGDHVLPLLFREGLVELDPEVARASAVAYWPGGEGEVLEEVAIESADLVVVYGDDATVRSVRGRARATSPVVAYPHRVSFAVVDPHASAGGGRVAAAETARAIALFEQRGCVSPHLVYVLGEIEAAEAFAGRLAEALDALAHELPAVEPDPGLASALHQAVGAAEVVAAAGRGRVWVGSDRSWSVVLETEIEFQPSCLGRFVRVKPAPSPQALLDAVRPWRRHLQTVGVSAVTGETLAELAEALARMGVTRIAPLSDVPFPPAWWHHDGVGALSALLRWTDVEG